MNAISNPAAPGGQIRVLVIDDSALMRQMLTALLETDPHITVVGAASDPLIARELIKQLNPDVLTLDVEMPRMDGLAFLEKVMTLRPMPVVMVSSLTETGAGATLRALELGAVDYIAKPKLDLKRGLAAMTHQLTGKIKMAARARVRPLGERPLPKPQSSGGYVSTETIIAIGASTGGVEALRDVVCAMPADFPGVMIAQHMPEKFTASFAARLDSIAAVRVREASDGMRVLPGHVYIAAGNTHLRLTRSGADYVCRVAQDGLVSGHRPSVDALFHSVAANAGAASIGVILTGMGRDGAEGLLAMARAGAVTLGQNEATSVVFGMPKAARALGAVQQEVALGSVVDELLKACRRQSVRI